MNKQTHSVRSATSANPDIDQERYSRYRDLRDRRGLTSNELAERQELRAWVAGKHRFPGLRLLPRRPGALQVVGSEVTGSQLRQFHTRLDESA
jgi:hypothetical protein